MTVRHAGTRAVAGYPRSDEEVRARQHVLERAYPLAKQLAEILELEAIEPLATDGKRLRIAIWDLLVRGRSTQQSADSPSAADESASSGPEESPDSLKMIHRESRS